MNGYRIGGLNMHAGKHYLQISELESESVLILPIHGKKFEARWIEFLCSNSYPFVVKKSFEQGARLSN